MLRLQRLRAIHHVPFCLLVGLSLPLLVGCPNLSPSLSQILSSQWGDDLEELLGLTDPNKIVTIRIINQSGLTEQLDLLIDGEPKTIICESVRNVCDFVLLECPSRVEAVQERRVDAAGKLHGARNFDGSETFIFTEDEFGTGSFLIFEFTTTEARAYVQ